MIFHVTVVLHWSVVDSIDSVHGDRFYGDSF